MFLQILDVTVRDSHLTGRSEVGFVRFPLSAIPPDGCIDVWLPVQPIVTGHKQEGELLLQLTYKARGAGTWLASLCHVVSLSSQ